MPDHIAQATAFSAEEGSRWINGGLISATSRAWMPLAWRLAGRRFDCAGGASRRLVHHCFGINALSRVRAFYGYELRRHNEATEERAPSQWQGWAYARDLAFYRDEERDEQAINAIAQRPSRHVAHLMGLICKNRGWYAIPIGRK